MDTTNFLLPFKLIDFVLEVFYLHCVFDSYLQYFLSNSFIIPA